VLDENNLSYGGEVSAPVFSEITQFALQQYGVNPTDLADVQYNAAQATARAAGNSCAVPHGSDLAAAMAALQARQASAQAPGGSTAGGGTTTDSLPPDPSKHT